MKNEIANPNKILIREFCILFLTRSCNTMNKTTTILLTAKFHIF
ncbi:hypothetical protein [Bdellovibrio sp. HCB337]